MGHNQAVLKMKAFVAVVAALCASAKAQYPFYPYAGYHGYAGYGYGAGLPIAHAAYAPATVATYAAAAPVIAPAAIAAPAPSVSSQFHSQDEFGNTAHGYANINSAKHEQGNGYLGVTGSYSYVDANGVLQTTNYIADGLGFRVQATNLPVAPVAPEVAAAKAEFQAKFDEIASREKRSTPAATAPLAPIAPFAPFYHHGAFAPAAYAPYHFAPAAPVAYAAGPVPAPVPTVVPSAGAREAILTKVQLNPGHAVAYRVD